MIAAFGSQRAVAAHVIQSLDHGQSVGAIVSGIDAVPAREQLYASLESYESRRRAARVAMWRALVAEGFSIGEIGRTFGVSRQYVSRLLRDQPDAVPPAVTG